jgi:hypothetical protein
MWGAILAGARRRRAPHLWPSPELPAVEDDAITSVLVRAYVLQEDERTRRLATPLTGATVTMPGSDPKLGDTVEDTGCKRVGKVMGFEGPYVQLRPIAGGIEWDACAEKLRPLTVVEALGAGMAVVNARSRGERL